MSDARLDGLILQLRDLAADIETLIEGKTRESLNSDLATERAIGMTLLVIAELVGRIADLSPALVSDHPEIPWAQIRGFRNFLAHEYLRVERSILWNTATVSVPALMSALDDIISHNRS